MDGILPFSMEVVTKWYQNQDCAQTLGGAYDFSTPAPVMTISLIMLWSVSRATLWKCRRIYVVRLYLYVYVYMCMFLHMYIHIIYMQYVYVYIWSTYITKPHESSQCHRILNGRFRGFHLRKWHKISHWGFPVLKTMVPMFILAKQGLLMRRRCEWSWLSS